MSTNVRQVRRWVGSIAMALVLSISGAANAFQLQALDGERVDLMDYVEPGRWTVIMFWATDCVPCEEQKPGLEVFHQQHHPDTAAVVGVAIDGYEMIDEIEKLNALHEPTYPNLVVFTDVFGRQYEEMTSKSFRTTPTFVIFNDQGEFHGNVYGYLPLNDLSAFIATQN